MHWVLRIYAYIVFLEMLPAIHATLEAMVYPEQHEECTNWMWDKETVTKANGTKISLLTHNICHCFQSWASLFFMRKLVLICLQFNMLFKAKHVRGINNGPADSLSRLQIRRFQQMAPSYMDNMRREIPISLRPHNWHLQ